MENEEIQDSGIASNRSKRVNAGSKMSKLLEAEDEDEFYKTTYGGFTEVNALIYIFLFIK